MFFKFYNISWRTYQVHTNCQYFVTDRNAHSFLSLDFWTCCLARDCLGCASGSQTVCALAPPGREGASEITDAVSLGIDCAEAWPGLWKVYVVAGDSAAQPSCRIAGLDRVYGGEDRLLITLITLTEPQTVSRWQAVRSVGECGFTYKHTYLVGGSNGKLCCHSTRMGC